MALNNFSALFVLTPVLFWIGVPLAGALAVLLRMPACETP